MMTTSTTSAFQTSATCQITGWADLSEVVGSGGPGQVMGILLESNIVISITLSSAHPHSVAKYLARRNPLLQAQSAGQALQVPRRPPARPNALLAANNNLIVSTMLIYILHICINT
jgi:hypothetical protein